MKFHRRITNAVNGFVPARSHSRSRVDRLSVVAICFGAASVVLCAALLFSQSKPAPQSVQPSKAAASNRLTDAQMGKMSSDELAHYIFEHHGCNNCHTLGA